MQVVRTNHSIHWLAAVLAASANAMPSSRLAIATAAASLALVAAGACIRHVGPGAGATRHFVAPALAVALALAAVLRAVA